MFPFIAIPSLLETLFTAAAGAMVVQTVEDLYEDVMGSDDEDDDD